ncbi:hypothetical protein ExPECSC064_03173 [Escherichia coli]|nr:hypothetical protein ExPECSC064_03173 [Escherichia coli]
MATMDSKYIQHLRKISAVLLRLISRTLKLFPFGLVMVPVILFYFAPDSFRKRQRSTVLTLIYW